MPDRVRGSLDWGTYANSFAFRLSQVRKRRGLTQEALAHEAGMHRNQVSNLERARSNREPYISDPQLSTVYRLAVALRVPPSYLLPDLDGLLDEQSAEMTAGSAVEEMLADRLGEIPDWFQHHRGPRRP
ncbi:MAG: helix-turn-helix transcriptional regulator [Gordonia sp. (in: high G+C Gram-positive bacteria)]|uniref:helix-turn-helix domain-containing protein n=1 Tax=Gordonia sp. (in: high G+C Gram-positive bacteria) TaxID=84139 RepID=UPI0039E6F725